MLRRLGILIGSFAATTLALAQSTITFVHTNDLHAHAEPSRVRDHVLGGYARQATLILKLRETEKNVVVLNGGDTFQGTLYFNTYEGLADLSFMNVIGYDAMAVGNHEFDRGPGPLGTFAKNARFPLLAANIDVRKEPTLKDVIKKSSVIEINGEKIGLVGAVTPDLPNISSPGPNVVMLDLFKSVQEEVNNLRRQGLNRIVLVSHCGYELEQELARRIRGLDVIIGGHSHTLLGDLKLKDIKSFGSYPTVIEGAEGAPVLVVQAWEWGKAVGKLVVSFDAEGHARAWEGAPIPVTQDIPENPFVKQLYAAFEKPIAELRRTRVGEAAIDLPRDSSGGDSLMGNVIADSMLEATKKYGAVAAMMNRGGVRSSLNAGPVNYGQLIEVQPFGNTLVVLELTGAELDSALELTQLLPSKGMSYNYESGAPEGSRVSEIRINDRLVRPNDKVTICFNSFSAGGGDGLSPLNQAKGKRTDTGIVDLDALIEYFKSNSPVRAQNERRIRRAR